MEGSPGREVGPMEAGWMGGDMPVEDGTTVVPPGDVDSSLVPSSAKNNSRVKSLQADFFYYSFIIDLL